MQDPGLALAAETAGETAVNTSPGLRVQAHGGALLSGGKPGNRGGGRPKESLRQRMRELLDATLNAMAAALSGERGAAEAYKRIANDPRITVLDASIQDIVLSACRDHITTKLTAREIGQFHETLARYGVGTQQEIESTENQVRYVIRLPARPSAETKRVAVVSPPVAHLPVRSPALPESTADEVR